MEFLKDITGKIDLRFCGIHRKILIYGLKNNNPINVGSLINDVSNCSDCMILLKPELEKIKKEITPMKIGTILTTLLTTK